MRYELWRHHVMLADKPKEIMRIARTFTDTTEYPCDSMKQVWHAGNMNDQFHLTRKRNGKKSCWRF